MTDKPEKDPRTVTLKGVRLSFTAGIKEKRKTSKEADAVPKYNFNIILEEGRPHHAENMAKVNAALRAAGEKQWKNPDAHKEIAEDNPKRVCFKEGRRFKNADGKIYAGYDGNWGMSVSGPSGGQRRPILKDKYKRDVEEKDIEAVFYGGTDADVIVSFYGTDKGSRGIFASAELVRSQQKGEAMGGGYFFDESDLDEMDDLDDEDGDDLLGGGSASGAGDLLG